MAENSETPKILEEISKGTNPKSGGASRTQKNARRRFLILLILSVPAFGGIAYLGYQQLAVKAGLVNMQELNASLAATITEYESQLGTLSSQVDNLPQQLAVDNSATEELAARIDTELNSLGEQLAILQTAQAEASVPQNLQWKLLEASYLVIFANRKLQLESDTGSAIRLLQDADAALLQSGSSNVLRARQAIAEDLAVLRELELFDLQGLYIRLQNLATQVDDIDLLTSMRENFQNQRNMESAPVAIGNQPTGVIDGTLNFLGSVFVWRRWEDSPQAMLIPGQDALIIERLRLILEQAQLALLRNDSLLYQRSLADASGWLVQYAVVDSDAGRAMTSELAALQEIDIAPVLPELIRSTSAVQQLAAAIR